MHKKQNGNIYDTQHDTGGIGWRIWQCAALFIRLAMACNQQWRAATWHINRKRSGGLTTLSTLVNETSGMAHANQLLLGAAYLGASVALGFVSLHCGTWLASRV